MMHSLQSAVTAGICLTLCLAVLARLPELYRLHRDCAAAQSAACAAMVCPAALCAVSDGTATDWPDCDPARLLQVLQQIRDLTDRQHQNGAGT